MQAAMFAASLVFGKSAEESEGLLNCFTALLDRMGKWDMLTLYGNIDEADIDDLEGEIENIWAHLVLVNAEDRAKGYHSIKEYLTDEEYNELSACFKSLLFPLLCFAGEDYSDWWQDILGSLAYNIPRIISNHYPEVTHAWLRSYDSLYALDTTPVKMDPSVKTGPSVAAVQLTHADETVQKVTPTGSSIPVRIEDVVRLIPDSAADVNAGESIYYQFTSPSGTPSVRGYHAYAEPFELKNLYFDYATEDEITMWVIAAHNGVKLDETKITLSFGESSAYLSAPNGDTENDEYLYDQEHLRVGESIVLNAPSAPTDRHAFCCWEVYFYDPATGNVATEIGPDKYLEYFGSDFDPSSENTIAYNMRGHNARFVPIYDEYIDALEITFVGFGMPWTVNCHNDRWSDQYYTVYWSRDAENDRYVGDFTLTVPEHIILAEDAVVTFGGLNGYYVSSPVIKSRTVSGRNVIFSVEFTPTNTTDAQNAFEALQYVFKARDLNLNTEENVKEYRFFYPEENITAPAFENMEFVKWQDDSTSPVISRSELESMIDNLSVIVYYRPVVNTVNVTFDKAVVVDETLPDLTSVCVTITNEWRVDNAVLSWDPSGVTATPRTVYVARITVNKGSLTGTNLSVPNSVSMPLAGAFAFADNVTVVIKDKNGNDIGITNYVFFEDGDNIILDLVFAKTGNQTIVRFADVSVTVPHSATQEEILQALPTEVFAYLKDGQMVSVPVLWSGVDALDPSTQEEQNVTAHGSSASEDYAIAVDLALTADVTVLALERTVRPFALPGNGEYTEGQRIYLAADDGATIYYALTEPNGQGQDPDPSALDYTEYTDPIILYESDNPILLYAYAQKDGLRDSSVVIYRYGVKHDLIKHEAKDATCTEAGNIGYWQCNICRKYYSDENGANEISPRDIVIPALGHDVVPHDGQAATCTESGWAAYDTCTRCDYTTYEVIPATGHTPSDWITTKEPTCTEKGSKHKVCTVCEAELEAEEIEALGHDIEHHDAKAVTCTEIGWDVYDTCSRCDYTTYEEIPAAGHDFGDWEITKEAQIGVKGEETRTCSVCGKTEKREIAALPYVPVIDDGEKVYSETVTEEAKDVTELFAQAKAEEGTVKIQADELVIVFDNDAVNAIGDSLVSISAKVSTENLTVENAELVLEVTLTGATFEGGKATVSIPFEKEVPAGKVAKVYYINDDGTRTDMNAVFAGGKVTFETTHFSTFAVLFEAEQSIPVDPDPSDPEVTPAPQKSGLSVGAIAGIAVAGAVVLAGAGVGCFLLKKRSKRGGKKDDASDDSENV